MPRFFCMPFACRTGVTESLDYSQKRLEEVPKEVLKARKHIEELLMGVNSIDHLPLELFRCSRLRRLDVSENRIKSIPPDICQLQLLADLNLSKNEIVEMPDEIGECRALTHLDVSTNIFPALPKSIVNLNNLTMLNICNNPLTQLPQDIDRLAALRFLDLGLCDLRALPPNIVRLVNLRVLDLCDNSLTELPPNMDGLASLELLDLHANQISHLPEDILRCRSLKTLDLSGNHITTLPSNFGDLENLSELTLCENLLGSLPSSIGRLKKLEILKASKNRLCELTPAICSCLVLTDLVLCENQLNELPSSMGHLRRLKFLDISVNNLQSLPSTIGGCVSLSVFSLRHNQLQQLPMEIGRLDKLQVLDLIDNNLKYLPYTMTVLYKSKLTALWLSFNQPPLPTLTPTHEPVMNIKVLTCYLLPQRTVPIPNGPRNKSVVIGNRVYFDGEIPPSSEDDNLPIGQFQRYDTPHPKPFAPKNRLLSLQQQQSPGDFPAANATANVSTEAKNNAAGSPSKEQQTATTSPPQTARCGQEPQIEMRPLRSVLKRPKSVISQISESDLGTTINTDRKVLRLIVERGSNGIEWSVVGGIDSIRYKDREGLFVSQLNAGGPAKIAGFRVDDRLLSVNGQDLTALSHGEAVQLINESGNQLEFMVERDESIREMNETSGLTEFEKSAASFPMAEESSPSLASPQLPTSSSSYLQQPLPQSPPPSSSSNNAKPSLPSISSHIPRYSRNTANSPPNSVPAPQALVNGVRVLPPQPASNPATQPTVAMGPIISVKLQRNHLGVLGFSIKGEGGAQDAVRVSALSPGGAADGKIYVGDRLICVGGVNVQNATHNEIVRLLAGSPNTTLELTIERSLSSVPEDPFVQPPLPPKKPRGQFIQQHANQEQSSAAKDQQLMPPGSTAFGELSLWRSMPLLADEAAAMTTAAVAKNLPQPPPRPEKKRHAPIAPGFSGAGGGGLISSTSASNLLLMVNGSGSKTTQQQQPTTKPFVRECDRPTPLAPIPSISSAAIPAHAQNNRVTSPQTTFSALKEQNGPLATSSPIPPASQKPSSIPVSSGTHGDNNGNSTYLKQQQPIAPPTAPKPEMLPEKLAFTSKLQHFERQISEQQLGKVSVATKPAISVGRPSGIPMKKPLVSQQDLEKIRAEESLRCIAADMAATTPGDEQRDALSALIQSNFQLLETSGAIKTSLSPTFPASSFQQSAATNGEILAPGAQLSRGSSMTRSMNAKTPAAEENGGGVLSRTSSSLSQRASELEKRQAWRAARLQSMDFESSRTDELMKLITQQQPSNQVQQSASPIPIQQ